MACSQVRPEWEWPNRFVGRTESSGTCNVRETTKKRMIHFWCVKSNKCTHPHTAVVALPNFQLQLEEVMQDGPHDHNLVLDTTVCEPLLVWYGSRGQFHLTQWCYSHDAMLPWRLVFLHTVDDVWHLDNPQPFRLTTSQRPAECMWIGQCGQTRLNMRQYCLFRSPTTWIWNTLQLLIDTTSAHCLLCMTMCIILLFSALSM